MDEKQISAVMSAMGRKGGKVRSEKQRVSMMKNLMIAQIKRREQQVETFSDPKKSLFEAILRSADLKREEQA